MEVRKLYTLSVMNVVGVNANGIRTKRKRLMLRKLLRELKTGVGIITGTHMRRSELRGMVFPDYYIGGEHCRPTPIGERIGGGVLILVNRSIVTEKLDRNEEIGQIIEHCVLRLSHTEDPQTEMRISGIYISPLNAELLTMEMLKAVGRTTKGQATDEDVPDLLIGDLNTRSWGQLYAEWTHSQGLQELVDPDIPTFALGSPIAKMLFLPGFYIPSSFLLPGSSRLQAASDLWEAPRFPSVVLDYPMFSDHSPIMVPLSSDTSQKGGGGGGFQKETGRTERRR